MSKPETIRAAIDLVGGPAAAAELWKLDGRLARRYYAGERELPPKRAAELAAELERMAKSATKIGRELLEA